MSLRAVAVFPQIKSDNLATFKAIAKELLHEIQKVDFIIGYDMFFNVDETRCVVLEEYSDASGVIEHVKRHSHFLEKLTALGGEIHGQMFPIDIEDENLRDIRESWNSLMHQHFAGKKNPGSL